MDTAGHDRETRLPPALRDALDWLAAAPGDEPLDDLGRLRVHLDALSRLRLPPASAIDLLELFQARADRAAAAARPLLLETQLPLARRLRTLVQELLAIDGHLAAGCLAAARGLAGPRRAESAHSPAAIGLRALNAIARRHETALLVSMAAPAGTWRDAYAAYRLIESAAPPVEAIGPARLRLQGLLALAAVQPENYAPPELALLIELLRAEARHVVLDAPAARDDAFWFQPEQDTPPIAAIRRRPPETPGVLGFSCAALGRHVLALLAGLATDVAPEALGLPPAAATADGRAVLARAATAWSTPARRRLSRRRNGRRVQVCPHLDPLWRNLRDGRSGSEDVELAPSDWMILNESPSGFAIMHVAGPLSGLVAGGAIGLRTGPDAPWHVCVVRWLRSDNPEHVELGIELLAPSAEAATLARNDAAGAATRLPALLLPALPRLGRGEALLAARGGFLPGGFALVAESGSGVRVSECQASRLALRTASVDLFEFERLPACA